ncbi:MAG TPA: ABC transporter permease [Acidobacteriaceae bacterium]
MSLSSRIRTWWRATTRRGKLDQQVTEELRFHIESYAEDLMRRGFSREEATRRARAELGSVAAVRENTRHAWGTRGLDELRGDLRYALRMLGKSPGFTAVAVGSLALGIGANTVIFTTAQHALLDRLHVPHPEQLRLLWMTNYDDVAQTFSGYFDRDPNGESVTTSFSYPVYTLLRKENQALADLCAFKNSRPMTATIDGEAESVSTEMVSGNYYPTLQVQPLLGRAINDADDRAPGSGPVVTISDNFWTRRFGRSPSVIGKVIDLNTTPMTIIGVNPPGFTGAFGAQQSPQIFLPLSMQPIVTPVGSKPWLDDGSIWWVLMMGRVKPGVSDAGAQANLNATFQAAVRATVPVKPKAKMPVLLLRDGSRGQNGAADWLAKPIYVLLSLAGFVLLLACANLANLLLARGSVRQREMSVRLAMGAGRRRILRQVLTESLLLSAMGGAAGLLLAYGARNFIPRLLADPWGPPAFNATFDWGIFAFTAAVSIVTGVVFGMAPAWQATRVNVSAALKEAAQTTTHRRRGLAGKAIVIVQMAVSMLLLVGAGLFVRTLFNLDTAHLGFNPDHLLLFNINPPAARYPAGKDVTLHRVLEQRLAAVPGVQAITMSQEPLLAGYMSNGYFVPSSAPKTAEQRVAYNNTVGTHFFSTMGIPIVAGRGFNDGDTETSKKVAVINRALAKEFFPHSNPIGQTFSGGDDDAVSITIVGICGDAYYDRIQSNIESTVYLPYRQSKSAFGPMNMTYEVSTRLKPDAIVPSLRAAVQSVDKNLPLVDIRTQKEQIAATMRQERILADLTAGFGLLALVLASIGIYGIMAYAVARRTNEIGIRMALGAQPGRVLRSVLGEASWMVLLGAVVGLSGALALGRLVASLLYGLKAWDLETLAGSAALLLLVALAASWIPARRAARVNPMQALRHE